MAADTACARAVLLWAKLIDYHGQANHQEYPLLPPKMVFDSEMWHPNSECCMGGRRKARKGEEGTLVNSEEGQYVADVTPDMPRRRRT